MSPIDGQEEFRGSTPDCAGYACREEVQVADRERGTAEEYLDKRERNDPSLVESLPGSDIAVDLSKIFSRMESMEPDHQISVQWQIFGQVGAPRD